MNEMKSLEKTYTRGGGEGCTSDGSEDFVGLKVSIPGFFGVGKFGKYFFWWLDL